MQNEDGDAQVRFATTMNRRSFLKGSALMGTLAAVGGMSGCAQEPASEVGEDQVPEEQTYVCGCHDNCGTMCAWDVKVRDGYVVNCEPHTYEDDAEGIHREGCGRGFLNVQRIYDADRLKYPMKRVNSKYEEPEWEQITWDEAIDLIVEKWQAALDEVGPTGLGFWSQFGTASLLGHGKMGSWRRLCQALGGSMVMTGHDGPFMNLVSKITGGTYASPASLRQTETFVFWGDNCMETKPQFWRYAMDAKRDHDVQIWTIDPNSTITAIKSDHHVTIKPATDGALALSIMQVVFEKGWEPKDFILNKTCAPYLVKEDGTCLRKSDLGIEIEDGGTDDIYVWDSSENTAKPIGEMADVANMAVEGNYEFEGFKVVTALTLLKERAAKYTPEVAEEITGVPASVIIELAEVMTSTKTQVWHQNGYTHYKNGAQGALAVYALMVVTGNVGKPGAGIDISYRGQTVPFNLDWYVTGSYGLQIPDNKLHEVVSKGMLDDIPVNLKTMVIWAGNMIGANGDRGMFEEAIRGIDFVVVPEFRMTDTCKLADLILPIPHWWEVDDAHLTMLLVPYVRIEEKAVEPQFEARSDYEIVQAIAQRLGVGQFFEGDIKEHLSFALGGEQNIELGCTYEDLLEKKHVRVAEDESAYPAEDTFLSENGRANFFLDKPAPTGNYGQKLDYREFNLPDFVPNAEVLDSSPLAEKYPILFITPHTKYGTQTTFHYAPWLHEILGEPLVHMNPADAEAYGLADGDYARFYNDRGECVVKVKINAGMMPGMVVNYHGWSKEHYKKGHYQYLSSNDNTDALTSNQSVFDVRVEVEKYEEA